jgi:membrane associated rhomboid family serine protease
MTPTPVGMRCPECARDRTKVKTMRTLPSAPVVTQALIVLNVLVFLAETASGTPLSGPSATSLGTVYVHGVLYGPSVAIGHEYWRLVSAGFLHDGIFHILVNMLSLYFVGTALEPAIGRVNFLAIYGASLLTGSFGALLFQPIALTAGASGAIFGILGGLVVVARARGISIWQSGLGFWLLLNVVLSVTYANISLGGHVGGLVGGLVCGWLVMEVGERRRQRALALVGCGAVAVASVVAAIAVAGGHGLFPHGLGLS